MNANTALQINDVVAHAINCGESREEITAQVNRAADRALEQKYEKALTELRAKQSAYTS